MDPTDFLNDFYKQTMNLVGSSNTISSDISDDIKNSLNIILEQSENFKGVLAVVITSIVYKIFNPDQDIRRHQTSIDNGYSGRTYDTKYITPFLKSVQFPAMAESGWLTRSLEQKVPYDINYTGALKSVELKTAFLDTLHKIESGADCEKLLSYIFQGLIIQRNKHTISLARPVDLPIDKIMLLLEQHFDFHYSSDGGARLPVLALYAVYKSLVNEAQRFDNKKLLPIESHTSADLRSGRIGDIEIVNNDDSESPFEAIEVKHGIPITSGLIKDAFNKFSVTQVTRYYLLSTANIDVNDIDGINKEIERIKNIHGCQVIANGLVKSLNYYLRMLNDTSKFINDYVTLLEKDEALKFEHRKKWNELISSM